MATAEEARLAVRNKYREMIGRNHYSQERRNYAFTPYSDGLYYSDCSSSISWTYKEAGYGFGILNTVGMWESEKLTDVPVIIKSGQITNPDVLRMLVVQCIYHFPQMDKQETPSKLNLLSISTSPLCSAREKSQRKPNLNSYALLII